MGLQRRPHALYTFAGGCRMASVEIELYNPPTFSTQQWKKRWKDIWRRLYRDSFEGISDNVVKNMRAVMLALHELRDYSTGLIDPDQNRLSAKARVKLTSLKIALKTLVLRGYLEIIPRRQYDPELPRPDGWKGRGMSRQVTNAYEIKLPEETLNWPDHAPEGTANPEEIFLGSYEGKPSEKTWPDCVVGRRLPSYKRVIHSSISKVIEPVDNVDKWKKTAFMDALRAFDLPERFLRL